MDVSWWQSAGTTLALIAFAEIGDKSQLVCMVLAARHRRVLPILLGAATAFFLLNAGAVLFGTALGAWIPQTWLLAAMAALFAVFGVHSLMHAEPDEDEAVGEVKVGGLFAATFAMIFVAEMGDKTQIAVAGLAGIYPATAVWLGATVALVLTSAMGALAGESLLGRLPVVWLHRIAGIFFLALAALAAFRLTQA